MSHKSTSGAESYHLCSSFSHAMPFKLFLSANINLFIYLFIHLSTHLFDFLVLTWMHYLDVAASWRGPLFA